MEKLRVVLLGAGAVGQVILQELARSPAIGEIVAADADSAALGRLARSPTASRVKLHKVGPGGVEELRPELPTGALAINAASPLLNASLMALAYDCGAHYFDLASAGPKEVTGHPGLPEQLAEHPRWHDQGLLGLPSLGLDPGLSNLLARSLASHCESVEAVRIRSGGTASAEGIPFVPLFAPEVYLEDLMLSPLVYTGGAFRRVEPLSGQEQFEFPPPVGTQSVILLAHEEVYTLPGSIGKGVREVDFKAAVPPAHREIATAAERLGLLRKEPVVVHGASVVPRELFRALLPSPASLPGRVHGTKVLTVELDGVVQKLPTTLRLSIGLDHDEAFLRARATALSYLTGLIPAIAAELLAEGRLSVRGVLPPEGLDPAPFLERLRADGLEVVQELRAHPMPEKPPKHERLAQRLRRGEASY